VFRDGTLDVDQIYPAGATQKDVAIQMRANDDDFPSVHILNPQRSPSPDRLNEAGRSVPVPPGYFKVLYRPEAGDEPARAIGFLLPHSYERLGFLADHYDGLDRGEAFWAFVSRIDLILKSSVAFVFPGYRMSSRRPGEVVGFSITEAGAIFGTGDCGVGTPAGGSATKAVKKCPAGRF